MGLLSLWTEAFPPRRPDTRSIRDISFRQDSDGGRSGAPPQGQVEIEKALRPKRGAKAPISHLKSARGEKEPILKEDWAASGMESSEALPSRRSTNWQDVAVNSEVSKLISDFCESSSLLRVKPTDDELGCLWQRCEAVDHQVPFPHSSKRLQLSNAVSSALLEQLSRVELGHEYKPQLRALCMIQFLYRKGDLERSMAEAALEEASEFLRHFAEDVPACREEALRIVELRKLAKVLPAGDDTEIGVSADGGLFIHKAAVKPVITNFANFDSLQEDGQDTREGSCVDTRESSCVDSATPREWWSCDDQEAHPDSAVPQQCERGVDQETRADSTMPQECDVDCVHGEMQATVLDAPSVNMTSGSDTESLANLAADVHSDADCGFVSDGAPENPTSPSLPSATGRHCGHGSSDRGDVAVDSLFCPAPALVQTDMHSLCRKTHSAHKESVPVWLEGLALGHYASVFEQAGYDDLRILEEIEDDEVKDLVVMLEMPPGHARQLQRGLGRLRASALVAAAEAAAAEAAATQAAAAEAAVAEVAAAEAAAAEAAATEGAAARAAAIETAATVPEERAAFDGEDSQASSEPMVESEFPERSADPMLPEEMAAFDCEDSQAEVAAVPAEISSSSMRPQERTACGSGHRAAEVAEMPAETSSSSMLLEESPDLDNEIREAESGEMLAEISTDAILIDTSPTRSADPTLESPWIEDWACTLCNDDDDDLPSRRLERLLKASAEAEAKARARPQKRLPFLPWGIEDTLPEPQDPFASFASEAHSELQALSQGIESRQV